MLTIDTGEPVRCLAYSPDGKRLVSGSESGRVDVWNPSTGKRVTSLSFDHKDSISVEDLSFTPTGDFLAIALSRGNVHLWTPKRGNEVTHKFGAAKHCEQLSTVQFSPSGQQLAVGGWNSRAIVCRRASEGTRLRVAHEIELKSPVKALAFVDGENLCITCFNGGLHFYDCKTGKLTTVFTNDASLESLLLIPGTNCAVIGDGRGKILLMEIPGGRDVGELVGHEWVVYSLAVTSDGEQLLSGSADGTVRLWKVEAQSEVKTFRWHSSWVTSVAISPDDMTAAAGSNDGTIVLWDLIED